MSLFITANFCVDELKEKNHNRTKQTVNYNFEIYWTSLIILPHFRSEKKKNDDDILIELDHAINLVAPKDKVNQFFIIQLLF